MTTSDDVKKKLTSMALLGGIAEDLQNTMIEAKREQYSKELADASVQLAGAALCIDEGLKLLDHIPNAGGWLVYLQLCMIRIQLKGISRQLGYKGK